jgi:hypothetical protein
MMRDNLGHPSESPQGTSTIQNGYEGAIAMATSLLWMLTVACLIDFVYLGAFSMSTSIRWMIVAILVCLAIRSKVEIMFALMVGSVAFRESRSLMSLEMYITVFVSMILLVFIGRYQEIRRKLATMAVQLCAGKSSSQIPYVSVMSGRLLRRFFTRGFGLMVKFTSIVALSTLLLNNQPWAINVEPWLQWSLANAQVLWPGPSLIVLVIALLIVVNEIAWRRKTPAQHRIYIRSESVRVHYQDLRRIIRQQLAKRRGQV